MSFVGARSEIVYHSAVPRHFMSSFAGPRVTLIALFLLLTFLAMHAQTPGFAPGVAIGNVNTYDITEASGIIASRQNAGVLWTHNDSGYRGSIFAISTNGTELGRHEIPDIYTGDFEDISFGPGPLPHFQYIYLGDIGDNYLTRESIRVFRFPEPAAYQFQSNAPVFAPIFGAEEITLFYPDGPFNCEGMMVDPITGDLFLATKMTNSTRIYRATRAELESGGPITLTFILETAAIRSVSGADISADGSLIAIRRPGKAGLWTRNPGESVGDALARAPTTIPVIGQLNGEPNGEAIGFDPTASSYYTISEGYLQPIYFFARTNTLPPQPRVFVPMGTYWFVEDSGTALPDSWRTQLDDNWISYFAPLGYGGGERGTISYGYEFNKNPTTYFRNVFSANSVLPADLALRICFNDGVAVYLNGTEIFRHNLDANASYDDYATASNTNQARTWFSFPVNPSLLRNGANVLAVEVHRADPDGPTLNFDAQLVEAMVELTTRVTSIQYSGGYCSIHVAGPSGHVAHVEASTDLRNWAPDQDVLLTNGKGTITEEATEPCRFFRIAP